MTKKVSREPLNISEENNEKYSLNWVGKSESIKHIQTNSKLTLVPDKKGSINFDSTENIFIEGDNLEVLKLLNKSYFGKIKMIYIDPPYNTGKNFVYKDNFKNYIQSYLEQTGQSKDGIKQTTNTKADGRSHSNWLSMMYPRLFIARNLLKEDGVIFVSIDDNEVHNLRHLMDEIFGEENFLAQLIWENKEGGGGSDSSFFRIKHEYILCYVKDICSAEINGVEISNKERYTSSDKHEKERGRYQLVKLNSASIQYSKSLDYPIEAPDKTKIYPSYGAKRACWRWSKKKLEWGFKNDFVVIKKGQDGKWAVYTKQYLKVDNEGKPLARKKRPMGVISNFSTTQASKHIEKLFGKKVFDYSKPYQLIEYLISLASTQDDYILDFFAGSGTTAHAVLELNKEDNGNRKFILVQLPEKTDKKSIAYKEGYKKISDITKERIKRVINKIKTEKSNDLEKLDLGFKSFILSNIKEGMKSQ